MPSISSHLCDSRALFTHMQLLAHQLSLCVKELKDLSLKHEEAVTVNKKHSNELHEQIAAVGEKLQNLQSRSDGEGLENVGRKVADLEAKVASAERTSVTHLDEVKLTVKSLEGKCEDNKQQLSRLQLSVQSKESRESQRAVTVKSGGNQSLVESKVEELERGLSTTKVGAVHMMCTLGTNGLCGIAILYSF